MLVFDQIDPSSAVLFDTGGRIYAITLTEWTNEWHWELNDDQFEVRKLLEERKDQVKVRCLLLNYVFRGPPAHL